MRLSKDQMADGWIAHHGGRQPCGDSCRVSVMFRDGTIREWYRPSTIAWEHGRIGLNYPQLHIIAYRKKPQ